MQGSQDRNNSEEFSISNAIYMLKESKATLIWWIGVVFILGQLGLFSAFMSNRENTFTENFKLQMMLGSFYSFAIACLGTNIFTCLHEIIFQRDIKYKQKKFMISGLSLIIIIIMIMIFLSIGSVDINNSMKVYIDSIDIIDIALQIICYAVSIILTLYLLAIQCKELGSELEHASNKQDKAKNKIVEGSKSQDKTDGKGNDI